eukprot:871045-Prorocentrum_lima.AAC.1
MTSSLVGSEMCIRDRVSPVVVAVVLRLPPVECSASRTGGRVVSSVRVAVSYTHLTLPTICSV